MHCDLIRVRSQTTALILLSPKAYVFLYFPIGITMESHIARCGRFILNDGQSQDLRFDPIWSHIAQCMHAHIVHCTLRMSNLYNTWLVHRAWRSVAGPTNSQWEYAFRFWIWYISIMSSAFNFGKYRKHQGSTIVCTCTCTCTCTCMYAYTVHVHAQCTCTQCRVHVQYVWIHAVGVCWSLKGYSWAGAKLCD